MQMRFLHPIRGENEIFLQSPFEDQAKEDIGHPGAVGVGNTKTLLFVNSCKGRRGCRKKASKHGLCSGIGPGEISGLQDDKQHSKEDVVFLAPLQSLGETSAMKP